MGKTHPRSAVIPTPHTAQVKTPPLMPRSGTSYKAVQHETRETAVIQALSDYAARWDHAVRSTASAVQNLPNHSRALIELQLLTNRLHAETEIVTRMGEAAASTLKRLQQSGSN